MSDLSLTAAIAQSNFLNVIANYKLPDEEVALCKEIYGNDKEASRRGYASMAALLPTAPYDDGIPKSGIGSWVHLTPNSFGKQKKVKQA
jgi:hypothetical protein